ncbi:hypothetical protein [Neobacillus kokaensis]|uniref:Type 4 fimbrial biogenesis protein PilX N-terminal domain-containing protein n=1 Tax=Neobacillus kokaensis TaxID=2759023 RepID=A0ABQ3N3U9_9BACI|nr:hypothetical protein [Neobacillus kokaensis]GHH97195.1 hypothetical protein AM1BK_07380 [Neobacillus kokaensis]
MNRIKNEQGYALVTVILMITLFTILFLSFTSLAFNSVKQNQVVERASRSVAAAEMGVSYYQVAIQKAFESKQQIVSDYIRANESLKSNFKREATIKMASELQNTTIAAPLNAQYSMKNYVVIADPDPSSNTIRISFNIIGTDNNKDTTLFAQMSINLDSIVNQAKEEVVTEKVLPTYDNINLTSGCTTLDCNEVYINGNGNFSGNNNLKDNQTIFTTGSLDLNGNGNENNKTNVKIHAEGSITIYQNMNSAENVTIETKDSASFLQNVQISGTSKILVNKTLTVSQNLGIVKNSFVYVGGNITTTDPYFKVATIGNNLDISTASKMCVNGNLAAKQITVNDTSKLYVLGKVWENNIEKPGYTTDSDTFLKECGADVPVDFKIKWGDNVNTVVNDVEYN